MAWLSGTMARELDMDPDSLRFDYSEDSLSPAYNVTAAQSKELATLLTLAERLRVHVSAITPDASALQRFGCQCITAIPAFLTFSSAMSGLA